ncbi:MAG: transposase family protein [Desulfobacterales bacterium]|nr:transposase family protein [Desulfobacterales bacterium]
MKPKVCVSIPNSKCKYENVQEETDARMYAATEQFRLLRAKLPVLLKRLSKIDDPRNPKKTKYRLTLLMIYGILVFVFQMSSRRQATGKMTHPVFKQNLKQLLPELEDLPHSDTLERLLERIDVSAIEAAQLDLVRTLMRKKKFSRYLINGCYPIAFDGTQKHQRDYLWAEECLERKVKDCDSARNQYYVYVLEVCLAIQNGMKIPLMSVFLSYQEGDSTSEKQDCEQRAFKRAAERLKKEFQRLPILVLLDGLYPNGPVFEICRDNHWDFMIVLQDKSLKSIWDEYYGLLKLLPENCHRRSWGNRRQCFRWVNGIEHYYDRRKKVKIHVVVCEESWQEIDRDTNQVVTKTSRHAWVSGKALEKSNLHERCNLAARYRWGIESEILVEKCCGYHYEHVFSYDWNAMKGFHYLMKIGRTINVLAQYSECLARMFVEKGVRGFIRFVRETLTGPWLDAELVQIRLAENYQLRLI